MSAVRPWAHEAQAHVALAIRHPPRRPSRLGGVGVNAISPGPVRTRAASGSAGFKKMYGGFSEIAPLRANITPEDVGRSAVYLASDLSSAVTGETLYVDGGFNIVGVPTGD